LNLGHRREFAVPGVQMGLEEKFPKSKNRVYADYGATIVFDMPPSVNQERRAEL